MYFFGNGKADGNRTMKDTLGGKGAGLGRDDQGRPAGAPGLHDLHRRLQSVLRSKGRKLTPAIESEIVDNVRKLEKAAGATLGSADNPLLVSVRSGAKFSMPGMMDTILNLGLNDDDRRGLEGAHAERPLRVRQLSPLHPDVRQRRARDSQGTPSSTSSRRSSTSAARRSTPISTKRPCARWSRATRAVVQTHTKKAFPQDPHEQLRGARNAVFRSWNNPRAQEYRRIYDIPDSIGTAVNVQMMVFGNTGDRSGTGVGFTRNPATGAKEFYGEFLINAQGEDVVAGIRTPQPIASSKR